MNVIGSFRDFYGLEEIKGRHVKEEIETELRAGRLVYQNTKSFEPNASIICATFSAE